MIDSPKVGFGDQYHIDVVVNPVNTDPFDSRVNKVTWPASVQLVLQAISKVDTGSILLRAIRDTNKWTLIMPPAPNSSAAQDAETRDYGGGLSLSWAHGRTFFPVITFDPRKMVWRFGGKPDEVLFHELVHAFRTLTGARGTGAPLTWLMKQTYDENEEFLAVVLANIYISDATNKSGRGLRLNHHGHYPLDPAVASSVRFFKAAPQVLPLLREFVKRHPDLARQLSDVKAAFNPIRALFDPSLTRLLAAMSASAYASDNAIADALVTVARDMYERYGPRTTPQLDLAQVYLAAMKVASEFEREALRMLRP